MATQIGRIEEQLMCVLTDDELQQRGRMLGETVVEIDDLNTQRTAAMKQFKERLTGMVERQRKLSTAIRNRAEERMVACRVEYHTPGEGMKRVIRLDTGEVVREVEMTASEKQMNLFAAQEEFEAFMEQQNVAKPDEQPAASGEDPLFRDAVRVVFEVGKASTALLQRRLRIGYTRAAQLVEAMEAQGIVGKADGSKPRELLHAPAWLEDKADGEDSSPSVN